MLAAPVTCTGIAFGCLLAAQPVAAQQNRIEWLKRHSVPMRTIAADSTDFSDLQPLVPLLTGVRVVQLAELSHGDGNGSAARVRLIKFLHQRLGFNVVVWEAGFYEVERMNALLAADVPLLQVPAAGLWWFWSESAQVAPLFDYARESWRTARPLRMAGFDLQFTGGVAALLQRIRDLRQWFERAERPLPTALLSALDSARQRLSRDTDTQAAARDTLLAHAPAVLAHFERNSAALRVTYGAVAAARIERVLSNMVEYRTMRFDRDRSLAGGPDGFAAFLESYNRRERINADNLLWLANERYTGEKLIVWSHNVHAAHTRMSGSYDSLLAAHTSGGLESTGRLAKLKLNDAMYSIGTTAYQGQWGFPGQPRQAVPKPAPGALVELLHRVGYAFAVVDLRTARTPRHWLLQPMPGSLSAQIPDRSYPVTWPEVFDGLLFVQRMTPADVVRSYGGDGRPAPY